MRLLSLIVVLAACDASYGIQIVFTEAGARDAATRVEVALVESCAAQDIGGDAVDPIREISFGIDESAPELGEAEPRSYGLYARAIDDGCTVVAAGCTPVTLEAAGDAQLVVELGDADRSLCASSESCSAGRCVDSDGGLVADVGADAFVDVRAEDATSDAPDVADAPDTDAGRDAGSDAGPDAGPVALVAHYACEDSFVDLSGNGHHASCVGPCPSFVEGVVGQGCIFDSTGYLEVPFDNAFDPSGGVSISTWVFLNPGSQFTSAVGMPYGTENANTWQVYFEMLLVVFVSEHLGGEDGIQRSRPILAEEWSHIVVTHDGETKTIYINGMRHSSQPRGPMLFDRQDITIGADRNMGVVAHRLTGRVDELKIFNRALDQDEVTALFNER